MPLWESAARFIGWARDRWRKMTELSKVILVACASAIVVTVLFSGIYVAWPFGPSTRAECILGSMKGVTSNTAAEAISRACNAKFPSPYKPECIPRDLTQTEMQNLKGTAAKFIGDSFWASLYNGNADVEVWGLSITISEPTSGTKRYDIRRDYGQNPFSEGLFHTQLTEPSAKWSWSIGGAIGCSISK